MKDSEMVNCGLLLLMSLNMLAAQNPPDSVLVDGPNVYIDCEECDMDFIKQHIPFIDYVIDRAVADIHVLITSQGTASGTKYFIRFIGRQKFAGMDDTLSFNTSDFDSEDTVRRKMVEKLKLGLVRFLAKTPLADDIQILFKKKPVTAVVDKWHNWVFDVELSTYFQGEQSNNYIYSSLSFSADKVTQDWKTESSIYYNYSRNSFELDDSTTVTSIIKGYGAWTRLVIGINNHWSYAGGLSFFSSSYNNEDFALKLAPAIEYNVFPYQQASSRELRLYYKAGYAYYNYQEETIYDRTEDKLLYESLTVELNTKQPWGSCNISLSGSHYFYDVTKNRVTLSSSLAFSLFKGLSLTLRGHGAWIHDQLSLPKRDLTPEEILLQIKQQATQYQFYVSIGFDYSFGSLYSNIVNPRFGD